MWYSPTASAQRGIKYSRERVKYHEGMIAELIQKIGGEPNYSI